MEVKKSTQFDALVKMTLSADGTAKTGLVYTDVTVYLQKQGGSSTVKSLSGASEWVEVDATNMPGVYRLRFSTTDNNTVGFNVFGVAASLCNKFIGVLEIVDNVESDTYSRVGAPQGASLAADVLNNATLIESQRGKHTWQGGAVPIYVAPTTGNDTTGNGSRAAPYATVTKALSVITGRHNIIHLVADNPSGVTTLTENVTISKAYTFIRGPGRDFKWTRAGNGATITVAADGVELQGFQLESPGASATSYGISIANYDFCRVHNLWINATNGSGISATNSKRLTVEDCHFLLTGAAAAGHGIDVNSTGGSCDYLEVCCSHFIGVQGDAIRLSGSGNINDAMIYDNVFMNSTGWGVNILAATRTTLTDNMFAGNASGSINDSGTDTDAMNNEQWAKDSVWSSAFAGRLLTVPKFLALK